MSTEYWTARLGALLECVTTESQGDGKAAANDAGRASTWGGERGDCEEAAAGRRSGQDSGSERAGSTEVCGHPPGKANSREKLGDAEGSTGAGSQATSPKTLELSGCDSGSDYEKTVDTEVGTPRCDDSQALLPIGFSDVSSATRKGAVAWVGIDSRLLQHNTKPLDSSSCRSEGSDHSVPKTLVTSPGPAGPPGSRQARSTRAGTFVGDLSPPPPGRQLAALDLAGLSSKLTNSNEVDVSVFSAGRWSFDSLAKKAPVHVDQSVQTDPTFQDLVLGLSKGSPYKDIPPANPFAMLSAKAESNPRPSLDLGSFISPPPSEPSPSFDIPIASPSRHDSKKRSWSDMDGKVLSAAKAKSKACSGGDDKSGNDTGTPPPKKKRVRFRRLGTSDDRQKLEDPRLGAIPVQTDAQSSMDGDGSPSERSPGPSRDPRLRKQGSRPPKVIKSILKKGSTAKVLKKKADTRTPKAAAPKAAAPKAAAPKATAPKAAAPKSERKVERTSGKAAMKEKKSTGPTVGRPLGKQAEVHETVEDVEPGRDSAGAWDNNGDLDWNGGDGGGLDLGDNNFLEQIVNPKGPPSIEGGPIDMNGDHAMSNSPSVSSTRESGQPPDGSTSSKNALGAENDTVMKQRQPPAGGDVADLMATDVFASIGDPMMGLLCEDDFVAEAMKAVVEGAVEDCAGEELFDVYIPSDPGSGECDSDPADEPTEIDDADVLGAILSQQGDERCGLLEGMECVPPPLVNSSEGPEGKDVLDELKTGKKKHKIRRKFLPTRIGTRRSGRLLRQRLENSRQEFAMLEGEYLHEFACLGSQTSYSQQHTPCTNRLPSESEGEENAKREAVISGKGEDGRKSEDATSDKVGDHATSQDAPSDIVGDHTKSQDAASDTVGEHAESQDAASDKVGDRAKSQDAASDKGPEAGTDGGERGSQKCRLRVTDYCIKKKSQKSSERKRLKRSANRGRGVRKKS
ncbi:hypothetical protein BSKO_09974 [Bryopsis sp. KO-2023]|nr:hypothetical protein BSKO_09974 [Bryopsis sp. KO-2023]